MVTPLVLQLLIAVTPSLQPASVPARGEQQTTLTLDRAGMIRLSARGGGGTACTVVDHLRGPFQSAGAAGVSDCALDLLLDPGVYRLRLSSPRGGRGTAALQAVAFAELNASPVRLEPGRSVEQPLASGQQASYWLHLDQRQPVVIRASGRTAGMIQLWRAGTWREDVPARDLAPSPLPGRPIHEWWIESSLEAGDYLVTVYGTAPLEWTEGTPSDLLSVQFGIAPAERSMEVRLPPWGSAVFAVPPARPDTPADLTAIATAEGPPAAAVQLGIHGGSLGAAQGACRIEPRALVPECVAAASGGNGEAHLLSLRGPPGTRVQLRWAPRSRTARMVDGEYRATSTSLPIEPLPAGEVLVGVHDVPADLDASPLGCVLFSDPTLAARRPLAADLPRVAPGRPMARAFNTSGDESIWFEVTAGGTYRISTDPARKERCELYRVEGSTTTRLSRTSEEAACQLQQHLQPGRHELRLSGGNRGIDRIRISADLGEPKESAGRGACLVRTRVDGDPLLLVTNRGGAAAVRGLVARPLPLTLAEPLPLELAPGDPLRLPVNVTGALRVRAAGGTPPACSLVHGGAGAVRDGACWLEVRGQDELVLTAPAGAPLRVWIDHPVPPRPAPPLQAFSPSLSPVPALSSQPTYLDLAPGEPHTFTFRVETPGLYHVRTEGLLSTECTLRTPTVVQLAHDRQGGRGRNCLLATYLDTGAYLLTVRATGRSRGRAAVVLERRPIRDLAPVTDGGEAFFRVPAGELVRERLSATASGLHALSTTAPGASLRCRLEDAKGWPLVPVPTSCSTQLELPRGDVLWTQLPLTVESMRHTRLEPVRPPVVLRGGAPHPVSFWTRYAVELSKGGRDTFTFALDADLDVFVELTGGMQGRIYREGEDRPVELVPAQEGGAAAPRPDAGDEDGDAGEAPDAEPDDAVEEEIAEPSPETGGEDEAEPSDGDEGEAPAPRVHRPPPPPPPVVLGTPPGTRLSLPAGRYRLVTEHSRGDVAISYALQLSAEILTPGMARDLPVPARVTVRMPRAGTLRLRTRGEADVRCRLFDAAGRLAAESAEVGIDWNCGLAQPLAAGDYALVIESETQTAGATRLSLSAPAVEDAGTLQSGKRYTVGDRVLTAALPTAAEGPGGGAVVQLDLSSTEPFSCAIEDEAGAVVSSRLETRACQALLHPMGRPFRVRLWSLERPAQVEAALRLRPVAPLDGKVPATGAGLATVAAAGRYRTAADVQCAPAGASGLLVPCGPEVSLEAGPTIFAAPGDAAVPLEELVSSVEQPATERRQVSRRPFIQAAASPAPMIHLLQARSAPGERAVPWCATEGGVQAPGAASDPACYAASGPTQRSTVRVLAPSDEPVEVQLVRQAVPFPAAPGRLEPGRQVVTLAGPSGRYLLPAGPGRLELLLPPGTWAVLLSGDRAVDLCPPGAELTRCVLHPRGGELLLAAGTDVRGATAGARDRRVETTLLTLPAAPQELVVGAEPWEGRVDPGTLLLRAPAAAGNRRLEVTGAAACLVRLADGTRLRTCSAAVPAHLAAEVLVDAAGPLRAAALPAAAGPGALFARPLSASAPALRSGEAVALGGALVERSFTLGEPSLVHLRADAGVCALASGAEVLAADGLGRGCAVDRLLPAGTQRLAVRPFGAEPLSGTVRFTVEPVETLIEGIGDERWVAPGETRMFRFHAAGRGRVGIGLQQAAEVLECTLLDAAQRTLATGCQAMLQVEAGDYLLAVHAPPTSPPARFRPVVLGLAGADVGVPQEYLRDLFQRIGDR